MGLVLSNIFMSGKIIATTEGAGIANHQPPTSNAVTPVASFTKVTNLVGNLVNAIFTDTSTNTPTSWAWSFGDDGTSTLQHPTHLFETVGTFNTTVTATNSAGANTSTSQSITVLAPDLAPVASFTKSATTGATPLSVTFTDTSINEPTSWLWHFGDGQTSTSQNPTHSYAAAGSYNVTLTATDAVGSNTSAAQAIVAVTAPVASFTKSATSGTTPLSVTFTDTSTFTPTSWAWAFGDGQTSTLQNPTHSYASAGTFNVTLTASNSAGSNTSASQSITVLAPDLAPVASFTKSVASGTYPLAVTFTDTSINGPTSWLWNFGDGQTSSIRNPLHTYASAGTFYVTLTATDAVGSNTSTAQSVTATVPPPSTGLVVNVGGVYALPMLGTGTGNTIHAQRLNDTQSIVAYQDGNVCDLVVATLNSDKSITLGTPVAFAGLYYPVMCMLTATVGIAVMSNYLQMFTISGSTITKTTGTKVNNFGLTNGGNVITAVASSSSIHRISDTRVAFSYGVLGLSGGVVMELDVPTTSATNITKAGHVYVYDAAYTSGGWGMAMTTTSEAVVVYNTTTPTVKAVAIQFTGGTPTAGAKITASPANCYMNSFNFITRLSDNSVVVTWRTGVISNVVLTTAGGVVTARAINVAGAGTVNPQFLSLNAFSTVRAINFAVLNTGTTHYLTALAIDPVTYAITAGTQTTINTFATPVQNGNCVFLNDTEAFVFASKGSVAGYTTIGYVNIP